MSLTQSTYSMILCQLLISEMKKLGMTQQNFFLNSGISQATWSRINLGRSQFNIEDLRAAAQTLSLKLPMLISSAEKISHQLPTMDVDVVDIRKPLQGQQAKGKDRASGKQLVGAVIATAALAFLIARIMKS